MWQAAYEDGATHADSTLWSSCLTELGRGALVRTSSGSIKLGTTLTSHIAWKGTNGSTNRTEEAKDPLLPHTMERWAQQNSEELTPFIMLLFGNQAQYSTSDHGTTPTSTDESSKIRSAQSENRKRSARVNENHLCACRGHPSYKPTLTAALRTPSSVVLSYLAAKAVNSSPSVLVLTLSPRLYFGLLTLITFS